METETLLKKEIKAVPKLRFNEFPGDWETKKLKDLADVKGGKRIPKGFSLQEEDNGYPYITVSDMENGTIGLANIKFVPEKVVKTIQNYRIKLSDIFISVAGTLGIVGKIPPQLDNANLTENANKLTNLKCNQDYLYQYLKTDKLEKLIENVKTSNAQQKLAIYAIKAFIVDIPTLPEQQKIASFLSAVDKKIQQLTRKKELLETYKKGVMQQLFSQEIRFKDDKGKYYPDWEEKKLKEICIMNPKSAGLPATFIYIDLDSVERGRLTKQNRISAIEAPSRAQRVLEKNDLLFQTVRPYQMNNLFFNRDGDYIASTGYAQLRVKENPMFLYQLLHTKNFVTKVLKRCTGTSYPAINSNDLARIRIKIPVEKEQQKIANYLSAIDKKIEAVSQQITKTQSFKKGLLQQMFV